MADIYFVITNYLKNVFNIIFIFSTYQLTRTLLLKLFFLHYFI